jgi:hypothetical protein
MVSLKEKVLRAVLLSYGGKSAIKEIYGDNCPVCGKKTEGGGICISCLGTNADSKYVGDVDFCLVCRTKIEKGKKVKLCDEHGDLFRIPRCDKCGTPAHPYFVEKIIKSGKLFAAGNYVCKYCREGKWKPYNILTGETIETDREEKVKKK